MKTESNRTKKNDITIKPTGKHNRTEIISRGDTLHGNFFIEIFGTGRPTEKIAKEKLTMDMGRKTAKRFWKNKTC